MVLESLKQLFTGQPKKPKTTRSPKWAAARKGWLVYHNICEACGTNKDLEVHHIIPVHIDESKELDQNNFITLCEQRSHDCHYHWGHLLDWMAYNPMCREDSAAFRQKVESRPYTMKQPE